jgi:hypothetical protein
MGQAKRRKAEIEELKKYTADLLTGTDFRNLPYEPASIDALILDPPYAHTGKNLSCWLSIPLQQRQHTGGSRFHPPFVWRWHSGSSAVFETQNRNNSRQDTG